MPACHSWVGHPAQFGQAKNVETLPSATAARKSDHVRINLERDVNAKGIGSGFEEYRLVHCALPEIDLAQVDMSVQLFGRTLRAPLLISCMTGGSSESARINQLLARVAQEFGLAMGLGSGRALLEHPEVTQTFSVRSIAPDILLFANLGAVQLNKGYGAQDCRRLVRALQADALVLHLNPIQEAVQPEGDTNFAGLLEKIARVCSELEYPVVVKEVGWGIAPSEVKALFEAGVAAVDLAGAGGTSWSEVERHRITETWRAKVAAEFSGWGISTADALIGARKVCPSQTIIASGGIRNGIDVVKAIALGANLAGVAGPFLRVADRGLDKTRDLAREFCEVIRIAMFGLGAGTLEVLRAGRRIQRTGNAL